jgi:ABC-type bacteriocin/lantibiotic exporter with double-glycine peptidase domain
MFEMQHVFRCLFLQATSVWYVTLYLLWNSQVLTYLQQVVVLKDQRNKAAHESSAQLACEAASAIRTVASLTREDDFLQLYSTSLEGPLRRSNRTALWSSLFFSLSQAMSFFVISLIFWYGSILVSHFEITVTGFFVALMVSREETSFSFSLTSAVSEHNLRGNSGWQCLRFRTRYLVRQGCWCSNHQAH